MNESFSLLDSFFSVYLGCDLGSVGPGEVLVCTSVRREKRELHYANAFPVWCFVTRNRCVLSVQPALHDAVSRFVKGKPAERFREKGTAEELMATAVSTLAVDSCMDHAAGPVLFCSKETFRGTRLQACRPVSNTDKPALAAAGLLSSALSESIVAGTCFAGFAGARPVALCGVCPVPHMPDRVADVSLDGTLEPFRRLGFGRTVLSAVTEVVIARGQLPFYITSDTNIASQRTAASVGYVEYGWQLRVKMPAEQ